MWTNLFALAPKTGRNENRKKNVAANSAAPFPHFARYFFFSFANVFYWELLEREQQILFFHFLKRLSLIYLWLNGNTYPQKCTKWIFMTTIIKKKLKMVTWLFCTKKLNAHYTLPYRWACWWTQWSHRLHKRSVLEAEVTLSELEGGVLIYT